MKCELYHDNFQNFKRYNIPKAQLVIADIPYNIGVDAYASNPMWYNGGDNKTEKVSLQSRAFSTRTEHSKLRSTCTSVIVCCARNRRKRGKLRQ